jgi:hypothetical protein
MGKVMIIYPNQGIGPIKFGMSPEEVKALMGIEEVYEPWMGGNRNDSLLYPGGADPKKLYQGVMW